MKVRDPKCRMRNIESTCQFGILAIDTADTTVTDFLHGELYLFHKTDPACPVIGSLLGLFERRIGSTVYLRECTFDMIHFEEWYCLPAEYRHCRLSTRDELKSYFTALLERL